DVVDPLLVRRECDGIGVVNDALVCGRQFIPKIFECFGGRVKFVQLTTGSVHIDFATIAFLSLTNPETIGHLKASIFHFPGMDVVNPDGMSLLALVHYLCTAIGVDIPTWSDDDFPAQRIAQLPGDTMDPLEKVI